MILPIYFGKHAVNSYKVWRTIPEKLMASSDFLNEYVYSFEKALGELSTGKHSYYRLLTNSLHNTSLYSILLESDTLKADVDEIFSDLRKDPYELRECGYDFIKLLFNLKSSEKGKDIDAYHYLFDTELLNTVISNTYRGNAEGIAILNKFLLNASKEDLDKYLENIQTNCKFFSNYPVIILNKNIDSEEKIKMLKKTFVKKDLHNYISFLRNNTEDLMLLDVFIEAVVISNNRIKEKDVAVRDILGRFFLGNRNDSFSMSYASLKVKPGFTEFFTKYRKYFTPDFLNREHEPNRYYSSKNSNIKAIANCVIDFEDGIENKLNVAKKYKGAGDIIESIRRSLTGGKRMLECDPPLNNDDIIAFLNYDLYELSSRLTDGGLTEFPIKEYFDNVKSDNKFKYIRDLVNLFPDIFAKNIECLNPRTCQRFNDNYWGWVNTSKEDFDEFKIHFLDDLNPASLAIILKNFITLDNLRDGILLSGDYRTVKVVLAYHDYLLNTNFSEEHKALIKEYISFYNDDILLDSFLSIYSRKFSDGDVPYPTRQNKENYTPLSVLEKNFQTIILICKKYFDGESLGLELKEKFAAVVENIRLFASLKDI